MIFGSFCKMLGSGSYGLEVNLGKLQKKACKKQLVFKLLICIVHLQRRFFKLQLFLEQGYRSVMT